MLGACVFAIQICNQQKSICGEHVCLRSIFAKQQKRNVDPGNHDVVAIHICLKQNVEIGGTLFCCDSYLSKT